MADDLGVIYTDKKVQMLENKLHKIYTQAQKDISEKLESFVEKSAAKEQVLLQKVSDGKMTQEDFDHWKQGQVFYGRNWKAQQENIAHVLANANTIATGVINGEKTDVFVFNGNYTAYEFEHGFGVNFGFDLYNEQAVERLLRGKPKILPKKKLDVSKDEKWNMHNIRSQIAQGILQGESVPKIAKRLAEAVPNRNEKQMVLHARTAMTGAQNAGRMERFKEAQALGIEFKKVWLATFDGRTRDLHADLDGQAVKPDEEFEIDGYAVMYPGDPDGEPEMVYNCRCSMVTELDKYPSYFTRRVQEDGSIIKDQTYNQWYISKYAGNASASISQLQKVQSKLQKEINKLDVQNNKLEGVWYNQTVSYADYESKKDAIPKKKEYYEEKIAQAKKDGLYSDYFENKLAELEKFEENGKKYQELTSQLKETNDRILQLRPPEETKGPFTPEAYTQERLDNALWAKSPREADARLREYTGRIWRDATSFEKDSIYEYTQSFHKFNEPLRGIEYGTSRFLGVGNTDLNAGYADNGRMLNAMTDILNKSTYPDDVWLQRGVNFSGMDHFFNCDMDLLQYGSQQDLERELLGKTVTEYGFMSCGSSKGRGFDGDILLNVYAPSGTKMMYVEPFSAFTGGDGGRHWDGVSKQTNFGSELETILQQGTEFTVEKIEKSYGTIYVDLYVSGQNHQQRWVE